MTHPEQLLKELGIRYRGSCPPDVSVERVQEDSRKCEADTLFVAVPGARMDGHDFLEDAANRGARAALVTHEEIHSPRGMWLLHVQDARTALALCTQRLGGQPSCKMMVAGVTGTNGKTTVTYLLESIFRKAGLRPGLIGTINYRWGEHIEPASQTTPSPTQLVEYLNKMQREGVQAVAMEVSSHAIDQHRVDGMHFAAVALTNISQDHLDYHRSMDAYRQAKQRLFTEVLPENPKGVAVLNVDDASGREFAQATRARRTFTFSLHRETADLIVEQLTFHRTGMFMTLKAAGQEFTVSSPMHGLVNALNILTAAATALALEIPPAAIAEGCAEMSGTPGRFEVVSEHQPFRVIIDYAHTPDALTKILLQARRFARERLILVMGCGGDRDKEKRPLMGQAAARLADYIIITNDNPRTEDPKQIAEAIVEGIRAQEFSTARWSVNLDRTSAIKQGIQQARPGDAIVIAGKGHESEQVLADQRIHFDDREVARKVLTELGK